MTDDGVTLLNVPISATPNESVLNPPVCAPMTAFLFYDVFRAG